MNWILIYVIFSASAATTNLVKFQSKDACENAAKLIQYSLERSPFIRHFTICVKDN